jgi:hypothetical protein
MRVAEDGEADDRREMYRSDGFDLPFLALDPASSQSPHDSFMGETWTSMP